MACHQNSGLTVLCDATCRNRRTQRGRRTDPRQWGEDSGVRSIVGKPQTENFARAVSRANIQRQEKRSESLEPNQKRRFSPA